VQPALISNAICHEGRAGVIGVDATRTHNIAMLIVPMGNRFQTWKVEEEYVDWMVHRRIAGHIVPFLLPTSITPNLVTFLSGFAGFISGITVLVAFNARLLFILAAAFLLISATLDCLDGQLARARGQASRTGEVLDGIADTISMVSVFLGITIFTWRVTQSNIVWIFATVAGISTVIQCYLFDAVNLRYLRFLTGAHSNTPRNQPSNRASNSRDISAPSIERYLLSFLSLYRLAQQRTLPSLQPQFAEFNLARGRMRAWASIGLGTHRFCLYMTMLLSIVWPQAFLACFVLFSVVGNAVWMVLLAMEKKA
jgi:phosphatidylglycerophosphate synthase